jgi:hypothetical protein
MATNDEIIKKNGLYHINFPQKDINKALDLARADERVQAMKPAQTAYAQSTSPQQSRGFQQQTQEGLITFIADRINLSLPENVTNLELIKTAVENRIKELKEPEGKKGSK